MIACVKDQRRLAQAGDDGQPVANSGVDGLEVVFGGVVDVDGSAVVSNIKRCRTARPGYVRTTGFDCW